MSAIAARRRYRDRLSDLFLAVVTLMQSWGVHAQERRMLLQLDERMLKDIGITRVDATREAMKPFWRD
jgi:uncharacterized protein YjiS (DUF1127 family)